MITFSAYPKTQVNYTPISDPSSSPSIFVGQGLQTRLSAHLAHPRASLDLAYRTREPTKCRTAISGEGSMTSDGQQSTSATYVTGVSAYVPEMEYDSSVSAQSRYMTRCCAELYSFRCNVSKNTSPSLERRCPILPKIQ